MPVLRVISSGRGGPGLPGGVGSQLGLRRRLRLRVGAVGAHPLLGLGVVTDVFPVRGVPEGTLRVPGRGRPEGVGVGVAPPGRVVRRPDGRTHAPGRVLLAPPGLPRPPGPAV